ncbi:MAG: putative lipid II flippase FtsW [Methylococcaceae bacterium]|nr:putative lipid II flippase FtsW [Methylococcaceae bacterium]
MAKKKRQSKATESFHIDWLLLVITLSLIGLGYVMMVSSSLHLGAKTAGNSFHYPVRQLIHIIIAFIGSFVVVSIPMRFWEKYGSLLFIFGLFLLVMVLVPGVGVKVNGSTRWLSLMGVRIQASEVVKFFSVIYIASYVTRHQQTVETAFFSLFRPLLLFALACLLLLLEPDFGSAVVLLTIAVAVMYLGGARLGQFFILMALVSVLGKELIYSSEYRLARVTSFLNPWADAQDTGFQLVQALIAFGRGEVFGVGLGSGIQKIFYLPEAHTDFLFSVLAEELGLLGVLTVILLYSLLVIRAFMIGAKAEQSGLRFSAFVSYGLGVWFAFQSFINMGVNMGMLPTKGLTLPFMSYGGGSIIVMCAAVALLFRVYNEVVEKVAKAPKGKQEWVSE